MNNFGEVFADFSVITGCIFMILVSKFAEFCALSSNHTLLLPGFIDLAGIDLQG